MHAFLVINKLGAPSSESSKDNDVVFSSVLASFKVKSNIPLVHQAQIIKRIRIMNLNNLGGARLWERFLCSSLFLTPPKCCN